MNKIERHNLIKRVIRQNRVGTQEEIKIALEKEGVLVTQATLSRDLREIGLLKLRDDDGKHYYSLVNKTPSHLSQVVSPYVKRVARAQFTLVLHTALGEADVLANLIDAEQHSDILGTIAGADTLLVICKDDSAAQGLESDLQVLL